MIRILHMIGALEMGGSQALVMNLYRHMDREPIQFDFVLDHPDRDDYAAEVRPGGPDLHYAWLPRQRGGGAPGLGRVFYGAPGI